MFSYIAALCMIRLYRHATFPANVSVCCRVSDFGSIPEGRPHLQWRDRSGISPDSSVFEHHFTL